MNREVVRKNMHLRHRVGRWNIHPRLRTPSESGRVLEVIRGYIPFQAEDQALDIAEP